MPASQGWLGRYGHVKHAIRTVNGDRDSDGEPKIDGILFFLGCKDEQADVAVGYDAVYYAEGKPIPLAPLMNSTSYGVRNINIIS